MTVVAVIGPGDELHRALALACAEAGAAVALGSIARAQEFSLHSIGNELWSLGAEHFVRVMDAVDPTEAASFADEVFDRIGRPHILFYTTGPAPVVEADEISRDELLPLLDEQVSAPVLATQAFGRIMQREGGGTIVLVMPAKEGLPAALIGGALMGLAANTKRTWADYGVWVDTVPPDKAVQRLISALVVA